MMEHVERVRAEVTALLSRAGLNGSGVVLGVILFSVSFFGSIALTGALLVRLPPDYLVSDSPTKPDRAHLRAYLLRLLRHFAGIVLILVGLLLMLPGVPGQCLLTVIAGLFVSELPGTRALLRWLLRRPKVLAAVNKLRARYKHPPIEAPPRD